MLFRFPTRFAGPTSTNISSPAIVSVQLKHLVAHYCGMIKIVALYCSKGSTEWSHSVNHFLV